MASGRHTFIGCAEQQSQTEARPADPSMHQAGSGPCLHRDTCLHHGHHCIFSCGNIAALLTAGAGVWTSQMARSCWRPFQPHRHQLTAQVTPPPKLLRRYNGTHCCRTSLTGGWRRCYCRHSHLLNPSPHCYSHCRWRNRHSSKSSSSNSTKWSCLAGVQQPLHHCHHTLLCWQPHWTPMASHPVWKHNTMLLRGATMAAATMAENPTIAAAAVAAATAVMVVLAAARPTATALSAAVLAASRCSQGPLLASPLQSPVTICTASPGTKLRGSWRSFTAPW